LSEYDIRGEDGETKGRNVRHSAGHEAELTYSILSPHTRIADHTGALDALRGTGAGLAMVERMVADARAEG
jgi:uncharacterized protein